MHSLNMWRSYLMGKIFELRIDHTSLKYLFGHPTLNARQSRWLEFLSEYDFDIKHIKGKQNKVSDALNRRVHEIHSATISMWKSDLQNKILKDEKSNQMYLELKIKLHQSKTQQKMENYELREDEILMYKGKSYVSDD